MNSKVHLLLPSSVDWRAAPLASFFIRHSSDFSVFLLYKNTAQKLMLILNGWLMNLCPMWVRQEAIVAITIQTVPGANPMALVSFAPRVLQQEIQADHSPVSSAKVKDLCICTSTPPYVFMLVFGKELCHVFTVIIIYFKRYNTI